MILIDSMDRRFWFRSSVGLLFALAIGITLVPVADAQRQAPVTLSPNAQLSVLTILPGDAIYSLWGHTAFRVTDPALGIDWVYNYGTFDGFADGFVFKFAYGELDYFLSVAPFRAYVRSSEQERRSIIEQRLNLSTEQVQAVYSFLRTNAFEENATYRYDFLFDNCATRPRDVLRSVLGDSLSFPAAQPTEQSFRALFRPYMADQPFLATGLDLILGQTTDRIATTDEAVFLPLYLMDLLGQVTVRQEGADTPLVAATDTLLWIPESAAQRTVWPLPSMLMWIALVVALVATVRAYLARKWTAPRWDVLLFAVVGLMGLVMLLMWCCTLHHVTINNWNLVWAWPLHLLAAFTLRRPRRTWMRGYWSLTAVVTLLGAVGWWFWPQALPTAVLPLLLLLAVRAGWHAYRLGQPAQTPALA